MSWPVLLIFPVFEKLKVLSAMSLTVALTMKTNTPVFSIGFQYIRQLAKFGRKRSFIQTPPFSCTRLWRSWSKRFPSFFNIKLPFFSRSLFPVAAIIAAHRAIIVDQLCILMIAIRQIQERDKKCIHLGPKMGVGVIVTKLHQLLDNKGNPHQSAGCFKQQPLAETAKIHPIWLEGVP